MLTYTSVFVCVALRLPEQGERSHGEEIDLVANGDWICESWLAGRACVCKVWFHILV
jgi:hypothetical protein